MLNHISGLYPPAASSILTVVTNKIVPDFAKCLPGQAGGWGGDAKSPVVENTVGILLCLQLDYFFVTDFQDQNLWAK